MSEHALEPVAEMVDVEKAAKAAGVELRGEDGQPYCCGKRMQVKTGMVGPDYCKCHQCGTELCNMFSPHINGGYVMSDEWIAKHGKNTWVALKTKEGERNASN